MNSLYDTYFVKQTQILVLHFTKIYFSSLLLSLLYTNILILIRTLPDKIYAHLPLQTLIWHKTKDVSTVSSLKSA